MTDVIIPTKEQFVKLLYGEITIADLRRAREAKKERREQGQRQNEMEARFQKLGTNSLIRMLRACRQHRRFNDDIDLEYYAIKKVLATREHVPRAKEARKQRQELARKNRGGGKSKNR